MSKRKQREAEIALHFAIQKGDVEKVSRLLQQGVDPNALGERSNNFKYAFTSLCAAISAAANTIWPEREELINATKEIFPELQPIDIKAERANSIKIIQLLLE